MSKKIEPGKIVDEVNTRIIKELYKDPGNIPAWANKTYETYMENIKNKYRLLAESRGLTDIEIAEALKEAREGIDKLLDSVAKKPEFRDSLYKESYNKFKALDEDYSWSDLLQEIYEDAYYLNEIFVRLVEEQEGVNITSGKQLQELTGITECNSYWDKDKGFLTQEEALDLSKKQKKPLKSYKATEKQIKEEAYRGMEDTFIKAMYFRYYTTLENMLEAGASYKDLLLLEPGSFNLSESWEGCLASNQYTAILWAISMTFEVDEPGSYSNPDLRAIAEEIGAPYSVLMDCYRLFNK